MKNGDIWLFLVVDIDSIHACISYVVDKKLFLILFHDFYWKKTWKFQMAAPVTESSENDAMFLLKNNWIFQMAAPVTESSENNAMFLLKNNWIFQMEAPVTESIACTKSPGKNTVFKHYWLSSVNLLI